ncbi:MAG: class I adenylate-forming enzyme family protein [Streptosporangiaceae bacterium]|jgi:acyl-CoA synthetase (AMP-forming)/AMP-acid ligase II
MTGWRAPPALGRISDYPFHYATVDPGRPALLFEQDVLSYGGLAERVEVFARALYASGVRPGDRVAVLSTPRPEFFVICLATARLGGIWLGLNPAHTVDELTYVLQDAKPRLVFTMARFEGRDYAPDVRRAAHLARSRAEVLPLAGLPDRDPFLDRAAAADAAAAATAAATVTPAQPALIVYTSGSTGAPKGALIRHAGLVRLGRVESAQWAVPRLRLICNLPIDHIGGVGDLCCVPLVAGGSIVFQQRFDAQQTLDAIAPYQVTALFQVPTQLQRIAALAGFSTADLSSLRAVGWGGGPLPLEVIRCYRRLSVALTATYGATEVTSSVTYTDPGADDEVLAATVGRPDPELDVRLLTDDGRWGEAGEEGEVCVRHPSVMAGYYHRPADTAAVFTADGWLRTGDRGLLRRDGNLRLVARHKEMFKSGGYNIYPREIELALESHPAVAAAAVVSRPDADYQAVGVAFIEPQPGTAVTAEELAAWCRQRLANYKVPKQIHIIDSLPLLPVGKIDRPLLARTATVPSAAPNRERPPAAR